MRERKELMGEDRRMKSSSSRETSLACHLSNELEDARTLTSSVSWSVPPRPPSS